MNSDDVKRITAAFNGLRVLVVGDVYLDETLHGNLTGISLEAPVPIFEVADRSYNPGAAGNVACNFAALGAQTALVGVIGEDHNADMLRAGLHDAGVDASSLVRDGSRPMNIYGKVRAGGGPVAEQEILRIDTAKPPPLTKNFEDAVIDALRKRAAQSDVIVAIDQEGSVLTDRVREAVLEAAREAKALSAADSRANIAAFAGFDLLLPNARELGLSNSDETNLRIAARALLKRSRYLLVTRGPEGLTAFSAEGEFHVPAAASKVVDVTGAGDCVTAAATLTLGAGGSIQDAAFLGNRAGCLAVAKAGAVTISIEELEGS